MTASLFALFHFLPTPPHPTPRKALLLGLRYSGLCAELKAYHAQSQELGNAAGHRQLLLRELQAKQQRILQWRQLVVRYRACRKGRAEVMLDLRGVGREEVRGGGHREQV